MGDLDFTGKRVLAIGGSSRVAPGPVKTKLTKMMTDDPKRREAQPKVSRFGTPDDIAGAVFYLASPLVDHVVGQTIAVDGGNTL